MPDIQTLFNTTCIQYTGLNLEVWSGASRLCIYSFPWKKKNHINKVKAYLPHDLSSHGKINLTTLGPKRSVVFIGLDVHCCNYEVALIL